MVCWEAYHLPSFFIVNHSKKEITMLTTRQKTDIAVERMVSSMQGNPQWIPPIGIMSYVSDTLTETFGFDLTRMNPLWIPICITAAVDWIRVTGWWPYYYTAYFHSGEEYKTVWKWSGSTDSVEMDPSIYKIFRQDASASMFFTRRNNPGLSNMEKTEVVSFIRDVYCVQLKVEKPPVEVVERAVWATLMWVSDQEGDDWLYMLSHLISSCKDFGIGFIHSMYKDAPPDVSKIEYAFNVMEVSDQKTFQFLDIVKEALKYLNFDVGNTYEPLTQEFVNSLVRFKDQEQLEQSPIIDEPVIEALRTSLEGTDLLDPLRMICTTRPTGTCSSCAQNLWCVGQYHVQMDVAGSSFLCSACSIDMEQKGVSIMDLSGENLKNACESCLNQACPHIQMETDQYGVSIPKLVIQAGTKQLESYRQYLLQQPDGTINGVTAQDFLNYYQGNRLGQNGMLGG